MQNIDGIISGLVQTANWIEGVPGTGRTNRHTLVTPVKRRLLTDELLDKFQAKLKSMGIKFAVTPIEGAGGIVYIDIDSNAHRDAWAKNGVVMSDETLVLKHVEQSRVGDIALKITNSLDNEINIMECACALACVLTSIIDTSPNRIAASAAVIGSLQVNLQGSNLTLEEAIKVQGMIRHMGAMRLCGPRRPCPKPSPRRCTDELLGD